MSLQFAPIEYYGESVISFFVVAPFEVDGIVYRSYYCEGPTTQTNCSNYMVGLRHDLHIFENLGAPDDDEAFTDSDGFVNGNEFCVESGDTFHYRCSEFFQLDELDDFDRYVESLPSPA